jgi:O-antigen/teichoic acid export membrane protein
MPPSFRRNFAWILAGSTGLAASQFVLLIIIAKLGSTKLAGDWALALAITGPLFVALRFKLRAVQASDARNEYTWADYAMMIIVGSVVGAIVLCGIVLVGYRDATAFVILAVGASKILDAGSELVYGQEQQHEHMDRIGRSQLFRAAASAVAGGAFMWATHSVGWLAIGMCAGYAVGLAFDLARVRSLVSEGQRGPRWVPTEMASLARRAIPLGLVSGIGSLQSNVPRYFLEGYATREAVGIFGTLAMLMTIGGMLVTALANAALPRLAKTVVAEDWRRFRGYLWKLMGLGVLTAAAGIVVSFVFGKMILRLLYSEEYAAHSDVLTWLAVASGMQWIYVFLGTSLDAMRRFSIQPYIHGTSTLVIAGASWALIPPYGMRGAAWAMLLGFTVEAALFAIGVFLPLRRAEKITPTGDSAPATPAT